MAELVLGPVLRYVSGTDATVWVETDAPCTVEVVGHQARTFAVERHHYALVRIERLRPDSATPHDADPHGYEVDALYALARRMLREPPERWPHAMLWLGDQVYVAFARALPGDDGAEPMLETVYVRRLAA